MFFRTFASCSIVVSFSSSFCIVNSIACSSSSTEISSLSVCFSSFRSMIEVLLTNRRTGYLKIRPRTSRGFAMSRANLMLFKLAYTFGAISPKSTNTNVTKTTLIRKIIQSGIDELTRLLSNVKEDKMMIPILTKLLEIRIVARRLRCFVSRFKMILSV